MPDWESVSAMSAVGVAVITVAGILVKQGISMGVITEKISDLEECKVKVEEEAFLTEDAHEKLQASCRMDINKDIDSLRDDVKDLDQSVRMSEMRRNDERKEDEKRWRKTEDSLLEITMLIKLSVSSKMGGGVALDAVT